MNDLGALLEAAADARDAVRTVMTVSRALMVVRYHLKSERFQSLHVAGAIVAGLTALKKLVIPAPIDILYWNREAQAGAAAVLAIGKRTESESLHLRITGRMTRRAIEKFRRRGFHVAWGVPTPHQATVTVN